jgi:hypothetical protein
MNCLDHTFMPITASRPKGGAVYGIVERAVGAPGRT